LSSVLLYQLQSTVAGPISPYVIAAASQSGLPLNSTTGVISGTPTAGMTSTNYTVTAANSIGRDKPE